MSKYLAYPFLYDNPEDLRCDYEIFTDEISSTIGLLRGFIKDTELKEELSKINELVYHMNACLRTNITVTEAELKWLETRVLVYHEEVSNSVSKFVIPQGSIPSGYCHVIRTKCKALVRLLYRHQQQDNDVEEILFDFANLLSGYFFILALKLNKNENIEETEFISRNYN